MTTRSGIFSGVSTGFSGILMNGNTRAITSQTHSATSQPLARTLVLLAAHPQHEMRADAVGLEFALDDPFVALALQFLLMLEGFVLEQEKLLVLLADPVHQVAAARLDFVDLGAHEFVTTTRLGNVRGSLAVRSKTIPEKVCAARLVQLLQRMERLLEQLVPGAFRREGFELCIDGGKVARKLIESRTRFRDPLVERTRRHWRPEWFRVPCRWYRSRVLPQPPVGALLPVSSTASDNLS